MSLCITHCDQREENCAGDVLTANDEKHMRSASFILHIRTFAPSSAASPLSRHLTLTFCFCSCSVTDCTQSMSVTFCVLTKNNQKNTQKKPKTVGPAWQGLHWQPCLLASGPPDLALVVLWDTLPHYLIQPRPAPQRPIGSDANNMNSKWLTWVRNPEMKSILHAFCMGW